MAEKGWFADAADLYGWKFDAKTGRRLQYNSETRCLALAGRLKEAPLRAEDEDHTLLIWHQLKPLTVLKFWLQSRCL